MIVTGIGIMPADQSHVLRTEKQEARRFSLAHKKSRKRVLTMLSSEPAEISIREYIHIMNQECTAAVKKRTRMMDSSSGFQQKG